MVVSKVAPPRRTATVPRRSVAAPRRAAPPPRPAPAPHRALGLADGDVLDWYYAMLVARRLSERLQRLAVQGAIDVCIPSEGHEAAQIASMRALRPTDPAYLFYRSVPAAYARGMTAREILLDSFGRAEGPSSGGRNLPGHWSHRDRWLMSISGSVGTQIPHAVGSALAARLRGEDSVSIAYFGDGGASKSDFHEGLNFAAIHRLPLVLFCENNGVAISVPFARQSGAASVADRATAYGVAGASVDGTDPLAVYRATAAAAQRARRGGGPTLIEARVARLGQHTSQVPDLRAPEEIAAARERDPLVGFTAYLRRHGLLDRARRDALLERAEREVADAVAYAEGAPPPPPEAVGQHLTAASTAGG